MITNINSTLYRLFIHGEGGIEGDIYPMLNISTIILQSTCSNLQNFIKPLTILDNILTNKVLFDNKIPDSKKDYQVSKGLFSSYLSKILSILLKYLEKYSSFF